MINLDEVIKTISKSLDFPAKGRLKLNRSEARK